MFEDVIETARAGLLQPARTVQSSALSGPTSSRPSPVSTAMSRSRLTDGSTAAKNHGVVPQVRERGGQHERTCPDIER
jgi:hypothetical protein